MDLRSFARSPRLQACSAVFALLAALHPAGPAWSQTASPARAEPRFAIQFFAVEGATLLPQGAIASALARFSGEGKRFADIESAVEALRALYEKAGITAVEVLIPEQELQSGVVKLQVREATVKKVEIAGAKQRGPANVRRAVPSLQEGSTPVDTVLAEEIRLSNESPSRQMQITFRTEEDESLTGVLRVADRPAFGGQASLDNTGSKATGQWRVGLALQNSNLLDQDIVGGVQVQTSPGYVNEVKIFGLSLRAPIYTAGWTLDFSWISSNVDSGLLKTPGGDFQLSSVGDSRGLKLTRLLPRIGEWEPRISFGQDYRQVDSRVTSVNGGQSLVPDIELRPASITYAIGRRDDRTSVQLQASYSKNVPGSDRSAVSVFAEPGLRSSANPRYRIGRVNAAYSLTWKAGTMIAAWGGQWTDDALLSAEQFSIGGDGSVRGFNGRVASGDKGQRLSLEWQAPLREGAKGWGLQWGWQGFGEIAQVLRNKPLPGEKVQTTLSSVGAGLRATWRESTLMRADIGGVAAGDGLAKPGDFYIHVSLIHAF